MAGIGYADELGRFDFTTGTSDAFDTGELFLDDDTGDLIGAIGGAVKSVGRAVGKAAKGAARGIASVTSEAIDTVDDAIKAAQKVPGIGFIIPHPRLLARGLQELQRSPLWNVAQTGVSFIPGVGQGVSAGMAAAAALGSGKSLEDAALAAAKNALPGGPVAAAAFDVAVGLAKGRKLTDAAVAAARKQIPGGAIGRAAFDAATVLARRGSLKRSAAVIVGKAIPKGPARAAYQRALQAAAKQKTKRRPITPFPQLRGGAQVAAAALQKRPQLRRMTPRRVGEALSVSPVDVRDAIAAFITRFSKTRELGWRDVGDLETFDECCGRAGIDTGAFFGNVARATARTVARKRSKLKVKHPSRRVTRARLLALYKRGNPNVRKAILAHGFLARVARDTGELTGRAQWTVRSGDFPYAIAQKVAGDGNRWKEIVPVNPGMTIYKDSAGRTQVKPWAVGQVINIPPGWLGAEIVAPPGPSTGTYTIKSGDAPYMVAKALTGDANRWRELPGLNPGMRIVTDAQGRTQLVPWQVGQVLRVWGGTTTTTTTTKPAETTTTTTKPAETTTTTKPAETTTTTKPAETTTTKPAETTTTKPAETTKPPGPVSDRSIAFTQIELAIFYQAKGSTVPLAIAPQFGASPADFAGLWEARSTAAMAGFQKWANRTGGLAMAPLREDGQPDAPSVAALDKWVTAIAVPAEVEKIRTQPTKPTKPAETSTTPKPATSSGSSIVLPLALAALSFL